MQLVLYLFFMDDYKFGSIGLTKELMNQQSAIVRSSARLLDILLQIWKIRRYTLLFAEGIIIKVINYLYGYYSFRRNRDLSTYAKSYTNKVSDCQYCDMHLMTRKRRKMNLNDRLRRKCTYNQYISLLST